MGRPYSGRRTVTSVEWRHDWRVYCKVVNRRKMPGQMSHGSIVACMIALKKQDPERFYRLFNAGPSSSDRSGPVTAPDQSIGDTTIPGHNPVASAEGLRVEDDDCGLLKAHQERELATFLDDFIVYGTFPADPTGVPACLDGELYLPLFGESHAQVAKKQRRLLPENNQMIRVQVDKLLDCGIILPSKAP